MTPKSHTVIILLSAIVLILVFLALQLLTPGEKIDQTVSDNAHIVFSADHGMVFAPGACVTLRWQVDHIREVRFDDQSAVGQDVESVCGTSQTTHILHVEFQDGTSQDYSLQVKFLVEQPATWLLGCTALLLGLVSLYVAISHSSPTAVWTSAIQSPWQIRVFAGIGLLLSGVLLALLLLEFSLRLYFGQFGTLQEKQSYLYSRDEIQAQRSSSLLLPFVEHGLSPYFPGHNTLGYRGDEIQVPKPSGVYRIVALGDSATYGSFVTYDKTYPYDLQQALRNDYGYKNVEVINAGVPSYTTWNMLLDLAFRISELQPDLVIVDAGWNDLGARELSPDCYNSPSPLLGIEPARQISVQTGELSRSAFYRLLAIAFGWMENPAHASESVIASPLQCTSQVASEIPQNLQANPPVYFERNLRELIGVSNVLGIRIMLMSQAYNVNVPYFPEFRRPAIIQHNAITARVAQENGVLFFDYAALAPTDKNSWVDAVHLTTRGSLEQARDVAKFLVDHNVILRKISNCLQTCASVWR
jgi:lysophospholipase L1-like esterase